MNTLIAWAGLFVVALFIAWWGNRNNQNGG